MLDTMCSYHTLNETVNKIYHSHFSILLNLPNELCLVILSTGKRYGIKSPPVLRPIYSQDVEHDLRIKFWWNTN